MFKDKIKKIIFWVVPVSVFMLAKYEYASRIGRLFSKKLVIDKSKKNYINLGCGNIYIDKIINIDFFTTKKKDYGLDLRYPFRIDSDCIDGIFSDHTFEHLAHAEIDSALSECYRIMKKGSKIRVIVPDMSVFIKKYYENDEQWFDQWKDVVLHDASRKHMHEYFTKLFALNFTSNFYYHQSSWDFDMGKHFLEKNGFSNVVKCSYKEGTEELLYDSSKADRKMISLYIEGTK
jgi:predicted SAM-dependent methyltransferase